MKGCDKFSMFTSQSQWFPAMPEFLLHWHWGNQGQLNSCSSASETTLLDIGEYTHEFTMNKNETKYKEVYVHFFEGHT